LVLWAGGSTGSLVFHKDCRSQDVLRSSARVEIVGTSVFVISASSLLRWEPGRPLDNTKNSSREDNKVRQQLIIHRQRLNETYIIPCYVDYTIPCWPGLGRPSD